MSCRSLMLRFAFFIASVAVFALAVTKWSNHDPLVPPPPTIVLGGVLFDVKTTSETHCENTSVPGKINQSIGGVAFNMASAVINAGGLPLLFSVTGTDAIGAHIRKIINGMRIDHIGMEVHEGSTPMFVSLSTGGELVTAVADTALLDQHVGAMINGSMLAFQMRVAKAALIDMNIEAEHVIRALALTEEHGVFTVIDPVSIPKAERLRAVLESGARVDLISPNRIELKALAADPNDDDDTEAWVHTASHELLARYPNLGGVITTMGARGVTLVERTRTLTLPAIPVESVVDSTGCGDAFIGATVGSLGATLCDWAIDPEVCVSKGLEAAARVLESDQSALFYV
ncbi:pfkB family carbohydrate kinase [Carpediemonas membranifera]|uniref:PfkB family carbohydrate kinase n=1 Tax=Carpediemonas membranifera TaxID=201153 RepID=A0A8J6BU24_9EUKA|nr:pfkB family carbohydrate kinase [Carpediemonas membranifera]|eukprot:KAG9389901.1 pfkB family carbohydrate kinase [Carpediemonas membranifera]